MSRAQLARYAAPAAFLLGVTVAVLLIHSSLSGGLATRTGTAGPGRSAPNATPARPAATATRARTSSTPAGLTFTATGAGARYVIVKKGDTFGAIAAREHTTVAAIEALNPGVSSNALQVGQKIRVR